MNQVNLQHNAFMSCDESLVCPKPLRFGNLANNNNVIRPFRLHSSQSGAVDVCDSKASADLFDIIRRKEDCGTGQTFSFLASSSPPFFLGSPPSRTTNPLAQDARFGDEKLLNPIISPSLSPFLSSPSSRVKGGGCGGRMKFGIKPATVRVEGFDCLNRDHQNSSIPAMA